MSEIVDCDYVVIRERRAADVPPRLAAVLRLVDRAIYPALILLVFGLLINDTLK